MKISVSVTPATLEIQDVDLSSSTATEVRELARERIASWLKFEAQADWEIVTEKQLTEKAA